jgi:peptide-methionine (S)-S-oxide reductase
MSSSLENSASTRVIGYGRPVLLIIAVLALTGIGLCAFPSAAKEGRAIPAPAIDEPHDATFEVAVLAGECFWGVQGVYQHVRGVTNAVSGIPEATRRRRNAKR